LADKAFTALNLTSAKQLSLLDIKPGYNQLQLLLNLEKDNIPVFRKSVQTLYRSEISTEQAAFIRDPYTIDQKDRRVYNVPTGHASVLLLI
jgi:hypothetical protein